MRVYGCTRCGSKHDFAREAPDRFCDHCAAPLEYQGIELSPWGENPCLRDYDAQAAP